MNNFIFRDFFAHVITFAVLLGGLFGAFDLIADGLKRNPGKKAVFHHADFDLSTVISLMKTGQVSSLNDLETKINDYSSGINNIDIDGDEVVDYIEIEEKKTEKFSRLVLLARPSKKTGASRGKLAIAGLKIELNKSLPQMVSISGGFPDYAGAYKKAYYQVSFPYSQELFWHTFFSESRTAYSSQNVASASNTKLTISERKSRRRTFYTLAGISLLATVARPNSYRISSKYTQNASRYTTTYRSRSSSYRSSRSYSGSSRYSGSSPSSRGSGSSSRSRGYSSGK